MEPKEVPSDLLPMLLIDLDKPNWATSTYQYFSAFHSGHLPQIPNEDDLKKWKQAAGDIIEELKILGVSKAQEKICDMLQSYFVFDRKNRSFCSMYDVVDLLGDPDFYDENTTLVRDMLHMFQYGIFRVGYNGWALECAREWMKKRNITYPSLRASERGRKGKGFVYRLLVSRASNSICFRLQTLTQRVFQEYVVVRDRKIKKFGEGYSLEPYTFNHRFSGYICKTITTTSSSTSTKEEETELSKLASLLGEAKSNGVSFDTFYQTMKSLVQTKQIAGKKG